MWRNGGKKTTKKHGSGDPFLFGGLPPRVREIQLKRMQKKSAKANQIYVNLSKNRPLLTSSHCRNPPPLTNQCPSATTFHDSDTRTPDRRPPTTPHPPARLPRPPGGGHTADVDVPQRAAGPQRPGKLHGALIPNAVAWREGTGGGWQAAESALQRPFQGPPEEGQGAKKVPSEGGHMGSRMTPPKVGPPPRTGTQPPSLGGWVPTPSPFKGHPATHPPTFPPRI